MYSRLEFEDCEDCFKSSFYLVGANHGQFNSSWGRYDTLFPAASLLNVDPLMDPVDQRAVAEILFSAFLDVTVFGHDTYRSFLARPERGAHWFPAGSSYLTNYSDARMISLVNFEEDADLLTGGASVDRLSGEGFSIWKEAEVPLRWRDLDSAAVLLGWGGEEDLEPVFDVRLLRGGLAVSPEMRLSFAVAMATDAPEGVEDFSVPEHLDFEVEVIDSGGLKAAVNLASRRPLYPQVDPVLYKLDSLSDAKASEPTFQRYAFSFRDWQNDNAAIDLNAIQTIRFRFPADVPASIWLDDLAISPDGL